MQVVRRCARVHARCLSVAPRAASHASSVAPPAYIPPALAVPASAPVSVGAVPQPVRPHVDARHASGVESSSPLDFVKVVSTIVRELGSTLEGWSLDDLSLCLAVLARIRAENAVQLNPYAGLASYGSVVTSPALVAQMKRFVQIAHEAYAPVKTKSQFCQSLPNSEYIDGECFADASSHCMSHFVANCHQVRSASAERDHAVTAVVTAGCWGRMSVVQRPPAGGQSLFIYFLRMCTAHFAGACACVPGRPPRRAPSSCPSAGRTRSRTPSSRRTRCPRRWAMASPTKVCRRVCLCRRVCASVRGGARTHTGAPLTLTCATNRDDVCGLQASFSPPAASFAVCHPCCVISSAGFLDTLPWWSATALAVRELRRAPCNVLRASRQRGDHCRPASRGGEHPVLFWLATATAAVAAAVAAARYHRRHRCGGGLSAASGVPKCAVLQLQRPTSVFTQPCAPVRRLRSIRH
jgi:hypothetical protein